MNDEAKKEEIEKKKAEIMNEVDESLDKFETILMETHDARFQEWMNGFSFGFGSAIVGFAVAGIIIKSVNKKND